MARDFYYSPDTQVDIVAASRMRRTRAESTPQHLERINERARALAEYFGSTAISNEAVAREIAGYESLENCTD